MTTLINILTIALKPLIIKLRKPAVEPIGWTLVDSALEEAAGDMSAPNDETTWSYIMVQLVHNHFNFSLGGYLYIAKVFKNFPLVAEACQNHPYIPGYSPEEVLDHISKTNSWNAWDRKFDAWEVGFEAKMAEILAF